MRKALGRGLDALIQRTDEDADAEQARDSVVKIPIGKIKPNRLQPRKHFDPEALSELAASIKEHGLTQPIIVSAGESDHDYELIAGERRLRASQLAGLKEIEAIIRRPKSNKERLLIALIENLQRENLNPIEQAHGYIKLMKESGISQTELGEIVKKSKAGISNTLRLMELPDEMQRALERGQITEGHARAILMVKNPHEKQRLFNAILTNKLSVRETEDMARVAEGLSEKRRKRTKAGDGAKPADVLSIETSLQQTLGTKVEIRMKKDHKGVLSIHFYSLDDFERILKLIHK